MIQSMCDPLLSEVNRLLLLTLLQVSILKDVLLNRMTVFLHNGLGDNVIDVTSSQVRNSRFLF